MNKQRILKIVFAVWLVLWVVFLVREDKDGQYGTLGYLYTHGDYAAKMSYITGSDFYDFLVFCRENLPDGATYKLSGFKEFSISRERARYFLWPLENVEEESDFMIIYGAGNKKVSGYMDFKSYDNKGRILIKKGGSR